MRCGNFLVVRCYVDICFILSPMIYSAINDIKMSINALDRLWSMHVLKSPSPNTKLGCGNILMQRYNDKKLSNFITYTSIYNKRYQNVNKSAWSPWKYACPIMTKTAKNVWITKSYYAALKVIAYMHLNITSIVENKFQKVRSLQMFSFWRLTAWVEDPMMVRISGINKVHLFIAEHSKLKQNVRRI